MAIFAVDPGRDKCGLVVADADGNTLVKVVVSTAEIVHHLEELSKEHRLEVLLVGDGTGSKEFRRRITQADPAVAERIVVVDEYRTSELARRRYVRDHRSGWRRLIPVSLQSPDRPYDDYVAEILVERYVAGRRSAMPPDDGE